MKGLSENLIKKYAVEFYNKGSQVAKKLNYHLNVTLFWGVNYVTNKRALVTLLAKKVH